MPLVETARKITIEHSGGRVEEYHEGEFTMTDISTDHRGSPADPVRYYQITINRPVEGD